ASCRRACLRRRRRALRSHGFRSGNRRARPRSAADMPRWLVIVILSLCALLWLAVRHNSAPLAAGSATGGASDACRVLRVPDVLDAAAVQTAQSAAPFRAGNATLTPLAAFSVSARVLSREDYSFGRESGFSP